MGEHIVTDFWHYGCAVLRNASLNLKRHCDVVNKHNISLEKFMDSGFSPLPTLQNNSDIELTYILNVFGETFEFHNEFLFKALSKLSSIRFRIVILYYCFEKTDKEICTLLQLSSRQSVQYQRQQAIIQLRQWIKEMEVDYAFP